MSGQERERLDVGGPYRAEVTMIERMDALHLKSLGDGDDRGVHDAEAGIGVSVHELHGALEIRTGQRFEAPVGSGQVAHELHLGAAPDP